MMDVPLASTALRLLVGTTVVVHLGLLLVAPIPSPVATRRMIRWRRSSQRSASEDIPPADPWPALLLPLAALTGLGAVLVAVVQTDVLPWLVPAQTRFPFWLTPASGVVLLAGNGLVAAAALTLNRRTRFDGDGQSVALVTEGIFGLTRHPIVLGLGLIYLGFFLALPSPLVLAGLLGYGGHQQRRLAAEEALLEKRFGSRYRAYRRRVGRFAPRWPKQKPHG